MTNFTNLLEAWIDVGGTFTDCYLRYVDGRLVRLKTLSSGRVPITVDRWLSPYELEVPELRNDAAGFWVGSRVHLVSVHGESMERSVIGFANGLVRLDKPTGPLARDQHLLATGELDLGLEAPVLAVRRLLGLPLERGLPSLRVRLGTTKGTNALLTRSGAKTVLAVTAPFEDLQIIGDQTRPDLFALGIDKPLPLASLTVGVRERMSASGQVWLPLDVEHACQALDQAREQGYESLAICLMHGYLHTAHEQQLMRLAASLGFEQISCSHQLAPLIELVARAQTTVVDAYLSPIVRGYLLRLVSQLGGAASVQLYVMTSAGGLVHWQEYSGKDSILSGPAGGVAALQSWALTDGCLRKPALIGLDMGGTSTDVCRVSGEHHLQYESTKAGIRILTPTLPIETVASGGGSVCWFDGVSMRVGPQSAGASPGPACYGRSGPLTITDVNLFLGRIPPQQFPFPVDQPAVERRLVELLEQSQGTLAINDLRELASGFRRIANEHMAEAVRTVSIAQGADPREHALVGFGGAAGQHICEIAQLLGIDQVLDSPEAGLLSALGMGLAQQRLDSALGVYQLLPTVDWRELQSRTTSETEHLKRLLQQQGAQPTNLYASCWLELRYAKTDTTLTIPWGVQLGEMEVYRRDFENFHRARYGYVRLGHSIELVAVRIEVSTLSQPAALAAGHQASDFFATSEASTARHPSTSATVAQQSGLLSLPGYQRSAMPVGQRLTGPCIVLNAGSTLVIDSGWAGECQTDGTLLLSRTKTAKGHNSKSSAVDTKNTSSQVAEVMDPIFRDCFAQRLSAIATQMGVVLQQTAVSVNVKQRRDYSCAIFDAQGQLLANAPHVPVHLGAMGKTVRAIVDQFHAMQTGDSFITNDPYQGGSHLPDVTVVTPVFRRHPITDVNSQRPSFFVANRAHHADIGGVAPGSMSVRAQRLGEEGVVIQPMRLTTAGESCLAELRECLQAAEYPPRDIDENMADIDAQLAANTRGVALLSEYAEAMTWQRLEAYPKHVLAAAEQRVRQFLQQKFSGSYQFEDFLDDGTPIRVRLAFHEDGGVTIDFAHSGPTSITNFNANPSIVTAAVMYVLRCLIADALPLNEGVMRCVELLVPEGILNPTPISKSAFCPAVAAGNVETSQRIVDVLLGALGVAAASQGTMNNLLFGNARFGFYETICGGSGAIRGAAGASGVHTHMTNTRLTDPEILESRYPVRLIEFRLRCGSGGGGRWPGGDGVVRTLEFLEPVELSLLTSRRGPYAPFGMGGGTAGALGHNTLIHPDGTRQRLDGCCQVSLVAGDRLEIKTPGGGGFGVA